jgi:galactose-1-phosphate uridylyltransferase
MTSYINQHKLSGEMLSTSELTQKIFTEQYSPYLYQGSYMSSAIMYRGNFNHMDIVKELSSLKEKKLATFVDWVPNAFKVGMCEKKPAVVSEGGF